ncbi:hypothetical protein IAT38_000675 [Cryptococcus sp. DSM 104549]
MFIQRPKLLTALLLTLHLVVGAPATAATSSNSTLTNETSPSFPALDKLKSAIESLRQRYGVPGITIGYAVSPTFAQDEAGATDVDDEANWTLGTASFGTADRYNSSVDAQTLFGIGSNSKLFTALAVGLLIYNETALPNGELLSYTTKLKDVLPNWGLMDDYSSDHADILDLLSMRSGLPRHDSSYGWVDANQVVSNMRHLKPTAEIRQAWQYSNIHYIALSQIFPTLTNISFTDYVQTHIFDTLHLDSATFDATAAAETGRRSDGFVREGIPLGEECLGTAENIGWWLGGRETHPLAAAGGIIMSASDMAKWVKELLQPSVLPSALVTGVVQTLSPTTGIASSPLVGIAMYGLAQSVYTYRGYAIHGHDGSVPGQQSLFARLPDQGFGLLVAVNDDDFGSALCQIIALVYLPSYPEVPIDPGEMPADVAGRYTNAGYGTFDVVEYLPGNTSEIVSYFPTDWTSSPNPLNLTGPIYVAHIDKVFVSYIAFTHFDGLLFNWTGGWASDKVGAHGEVTGVLVKPGGTGTAVLAEGGLALFGPVGPGPTVTARAVTDTDLAENADVWFVKDR